eukprot:scaffold3573_cov153-Skeletonema_menzelii.AAC.7
MFSTPFKGSPMHSPSMMPSMNQKRFFDQDHHGLTSSSPMHQQQRQDYDIYGGAHGRNGHLTEERDTSLAFPSRFGTTIQSHLSPRNRQHGFSPSNNPYSHHGDIGQLQGVWNAFESVISALEKELQDCLSNKAIFEACVVQEQSHHEGKRMTTAEKNEEARIRKTKYENTLDVAMNRYKGTFSNAVMAAQKEIQASIERNLEEHRHHFSRQLADMERSYANRISERESYFARQLDTKAADCDREVRRMQNECDQSDSAFQKLQNDMSIQKQTLTQSLHAAEEGREAAVTELAATLETLKSTCASAQESEVKLQEVERDLAELQLTLEAEVETNQILRSAQEEMKQAVGVEQERSHLLQQEKQQMEHSLQDTCQTLEQANQEISVLREQVAEVPKLQDALSETIKSLRESKQEYEKLSQEFDSCKENLDHTSEINSMLAGKVSALESQVEDQMLDLEAARMSETDVEASLEECMKKIKDQMLDLEAARMSEADVEASLEESLKKIDELTLLQKNLQDTQELNAKKFSEQMEALKQATAENEKLQQLNSSLRKERDGLKASMKKLQDECNEERNKIAIALSGFDEEMASAEANLRSTRKELEEEKAKVKVLRLPLEEATKKMEDEIALLKEENESDKAKFEKEASVYNEAIKMLQKQCDLLQGLVDNGCEKCSRNELTNEAHESGSSTEWEEVLKERDDEILQLKEKCVKREEFMATLEKLCAKARHDLVTLRKEKKDLEVAIQRYTNVHDIARCDDGTSKAVDELFGPIIDKAPSMNDIDNVINKGEKEFKNIITYVEDQIGAGVASCGDYGVECTLDEQDHQQDPPDSM